MPKNEKDHLRQFLIFVFVLLFPCFALWTFASPGLVTPVIGLVNIILTNWFPDIVSVVYQDGANAILMTLFDQVDGQWLRATEVGAGLGFKVDTRILTYAIPFYAALHFATEKKAYLTQFFWGLTLIYPCILIGIVCIFLKDLMLTMGPVFMEQEAVFVPGANVIGILYQFSVLIIPPLVPALIWAWQSRTTPLLRGLLSGIEPPTQDSAS